MQKLRTLFLLVSAGIVWWLAMRLFFVWSGAQSILGNPRMQSSKFIKVFVEYEPLPRMVADGSVVWKGFWVCGVLAAIAFLIVNPRLRGTWLRKGLVFGLLHWLLMTPWFEFYLPYNVMNEPLPLVLLEAGLWLCTLLVTGVYMSAVMNLSFHRNSGQMLHRIKV